MAGARVLDFPTASLPSWQTVPSSHAPVAHARQSNTRTTVLGVSSRFSLEGRAVKNQPALTTHARRATGCCGHTTSRLFVFIVISSVQVFTHVGFGFDCRLLCSAQHKGAYLGPQQQPGGPGALHKTRSAAAETSSQNSLIQAGITRCLGMSLHNWKP